MTSRDRFRVLIATTDGPAAIQKITAEDSGVPSVVCLDGTTKVLGISGDYARFVNRGTGLVAAQTGHDAYRLDLDAPVHGGLSWQLPVLLAHDLATDGRLAEPDDASAPAVLATGIVDRDRLVRPVDAIPEKIASARERIAAIRSQGAEVVVVLPATGEAESDENALAELGDGVSVLRWDRMGTLPGNLETDDGAVQAAESTPPTRVPVSNRTRALRVLPAGVALALVMLVALGWWQGPHRWEPLRRAGDYEGLDAALGSSFPPMAALYRLFLKSRATPLEDMGFAVIEHRPADGGSCAGRRFRSVGLTPTTLAPQRHGFFRSEGDRSLCNLTYTLTNRGEGLFYAYFAAVPVGATGGVWELNAAALPPMASISMELDPRELDARHTGVALLALASPGPSPHLRRALRTAAVDAASPSEKTGNPLPIASLPDLGVTVTSASHSIVGTALP